MLLSRHTFAIALALGAGTANSETACLEYSAAKVSITGTLKRLTFPGKPNFESIAQGDQAETGFYLSLKTPICTSGAIDEPDSYPQRNVSLVQLVLNDQQYKSLRKNVGGQVTLVGKLFASHTAHHHAPLLLQVSASNDGR
ncbi:MAG: DUF4431 domain-containing protein [Rhodocyclaceae bacterium]|nr:DUF4431 domain-containing protein [Azospira sp.]